MRIDCIQPGEEGDGGVGMMHQRLFLLLKARKCKVNRMQPVPLFISFDLIQFLLRKLHRSILNQIHTTQETLGNTLGSWRRENKKDDRVSEPIGITRNQIQAFTSQQKKPENDNQATKLKSWVGFTPIKPSLGLMLVY